MWVVALIFERFDAQAPDFRDRYQLRSMLYVCRVKMGGNFRCLFVGGSLLSNSKIFGVQ